MATRSQIERLAQRIEALGRTEDDGRPRLGIIELLHRDETEEQARARHKRRYPGDHVDSMHVWNPFMTAEEWTRKYCVGPVGQDPGKS
jgi:hypothetical protein